MVVSKFSTPAEASRNADSASWICLLMDLILRVKLSLFNDSDTTRSRSVSLMPAHLPSKEKLKNRCIHSEFRVYY